MTEPKSRWIRVLNPGPPNAVRLICFPHAGGNAASFQPFKATLASLSVLAVQPPGRLDRFAEPPIERLEVMLASLERELAPFLREPFAFLGHSFGSVLAFELSRRLLAKGRGPVRLFISGSPAPGTRVPSPLVEASDDELWKMMAQLQGTDASLIESPEVREFLLPPLRADARMDEQYRTWPVAPLHVPITALGALEDPEATPEQVKAWSQATTASFEMLPFEGHHFFLYEQAASIAPIILERLRAPSAAR